MPRFKEHYRSPLGFKLEGVFGKGSPYSVKTDPAYAAEVSADRKRPVKIAGEEYPWLRVIPCAKGRKVSGLKANLFPHSPTHVGFIGKGNTLRKALLEVPGVMPHQTGDEEFSITFPVELLPAIAPIVRPRLKRRGRASNFAPQSAGRPPESTP